MTWQQQFNEVPRRFAKPLPVRRHKMRIVSPDGATVAVCNSPKAAENWVRGTDYRVEVHT